LKSFNLRKLFVFTVAAMLLAAPSVQAADIWLTDLEAAKQQAATENKSVLVLFTGSAWCPACIKLNEKVLSTAEFQTEATKDYVLVKLDFVKDVAKSDPKNLKAAQAFGVRSFPSVYLTDAAGKVFGQTGYFPGLNGAVYAAHLKVFSDDSKLAAQSFADGVAATDDLTRAQKFHEAIERLTDNGASPGNYREEIRTIVKADPAETLKYGGQLPYRQLYVSLVSEQISNLVQAREIQKARAVLDLMIAEVKLADEEKQAIWFGIKGRLFEMEGNLAKAVEAYNEAIGFAPNSQLAAQIKEYLKELEGRQSDILDVNP
jgi:thioredoxin-related protein